MQTLIAFWNILRKDIENYYLKPPNISWGIIFPLSWTLMQLIRSQGDIGIEELLSGLMAMSVLFGTTSMLAVTITFERRSRSFDRLLIAPISISTLVIAKILGAILFGILNAFVPVIFAAFFINLSGINWGITLAAVILIAITSALLGLLIAVSAKEVFEAQTFSNFFRFPMLFLCGLFIPIDKLPVILKPISFCLPLTYGTDILNGAITGNSIFNAIFNISVMLVFTTLLFYLCLRNIKTKWIL
ncbi:MULTISPECIES: ABC transporter permease [Clostridia]|jgi:ABC-2 type transport system permease protein|uniref:Transport permease protein n=1 Tax=Lutispora thermophila DSM 19022 TaxID=1122184 RepID=A0A1M6I1N5_9FIRM|nr:MULTISPECIES: ABC transporter permease [Eubacteriales]SHJ28379.1 ABC-2 type transport system permease protein [Lutispora thermophila DSM 19022]